MFRYFPCAHGIKLIIKILISLGVSIVAITYVSEISEFLSNYIPADRATIYSYTLSSIIIVYAVTLLLLMQKAARDIQQIADNNPEPPDYWRDM